MQGSLLVAGMSSDAGKSVLAAGLCRWLHRRGVRVAPYNDLRSRFDVVVCEGAGSPAEINLRATDLSNMGLADARDIPVVVVADIDRGGVFAGLFGTLALLSARDQSLVGRRAAARQGPAARRRRPAAPHEQRDGRRLARVRAGRRRAVDDLARGRRRRRPRRAAGHPRHGRGPGLVAPHRDRGRGRRPGRSGPAAARDLRRLPDARRPDRGRRRVRGRRGRRAGPAAGPRRVRRREAGRTPGRQRVRRARHDRVRDPPRRRGPWPAAATPGSSRSSTGTAAAPSGARRGTARGSATASAGRSSPTSLARSGVVFGWVFASHMVGAAVAAAFAGAVREATGTYSPAWWTAGGLCLVAAVACLAVRQEPARDAVG